VVEVVRHPVVESRHRVAVAVVDGTGELIASHGNADLVIPPRSAIKSLQALPLVASGAADAFDFDSAELALACASHSGEPGHLETVAVMLGRLGLDESDLECGPSLPLDKRASGAFLAAGHQPRPLAHNCSGKHAGFLALARHRGVETRGYVEPTHPVQAQVLGAVAEACGVEIGEVGIDGCGAPVLSMPLWAIARGFASMVDPTATHHEPARRVRAAIAAEPWFVAGTARVDTRLCAALGDRGYVKTGAEGVYGAALVDGGVGIALKALDGATRAAEVAIVEVLRRLDAIDVTGDLADLVAPVVENAGGRAVGEIRVATG
jgi:L-asparaginase II